MKTVTCIINPSDKGAQLSSCLGIQPLIFTISRYLQQRLKQAEEDVALAKSNSSKYKVRQALDT